MAASDQDPVIPGLIGNFNIPKSVIENKVDVLTFLELMVRKGIVTPEELDEIRSAVVAHLNAAYPELELSYSTPEGGSQGPFNPPAAAPKSGGLANGAFQAAPNPLQAAPNPLANQSLAGASMSAPLPEKKEDESAEKPAGSPAPNPAKPAANPEKPLWVQAPPPRFIK